MGEESKLANLLPATGSISWYLVFCKPKQERIALENLERQGFVCYLPLLRSEKIRRQKLEVVSDPLFPRYLFIQLDSGERGRNWMPIQYSRGVQNLVKFGDSPARVDQRIIDYLQAREAESTDTPQELFQTGDHLRVTEGAFVGLEAIYQQKNAQNRINVLIEMMGKMVKVSLDASQVTAVD